MTTQHRDPEPLTPADQSLTLDRWLKREAVLRTRLRGPGLCAPEQFMSRSGLGAFEAMFTGEIPQPPISHTLKFLLVEASFGRAVYQGRPLFEHYNPLGSVHGGWIATLLDSAVACAVHTTLPQGKVYRTVEFKVNCVRPLTDQVPLVRAIGTTVHVGNRIASADGQLIGPDGTLYAHASSTCVIFDPDS